ncbi:hypothetical protein PVA44_04870 [Entomospira nematocerorum]|uniref:Uncharacterized protein n=1 Tax=Entomospira nematocerorum TaxID=2719987 RepID=A0A968GCM9_9SPIO|nr:hypothetical protein [Entomospira nematocera]NIZ46647.1 hypothetical protein [Entomospira nematocera]WDI33555.1 hypothetical protein PVA44_04870 [Entomospira nematocera]
MEQNDANIAKKRRNYHRIKRILVISGIIIGIMIVIFTGREMYTTMVLRKDSELMLNRLGLILLFAKIWMVLHLLNSRNGVKSGVIDVMQASNDTFKDKSKYLKINKIAIVLLVLMIIRQIIWL